MGEVAAIIEPHPDFESMTLAELEAERKELEDKISFAAEHGAEKSFESWLIQERRMLQAEIGRRNGHAVASRAANSDKKPPEPLLITMDQIKAEKVKALWDNRIYFGKLSLVDGDPDSGKTTISLALAASLSRGEALPLGKKPTGPSNVVIISCEDGYADTVRPRLDALGADVSRIAIPNPKRELATAMLNPSFVEQAVKDVGPALVIVDPLVAYVGRANTDKANEMREFLSKYRLIAERRGCAFIIIRHFNKQVDARAMYRGAGSIDIMAIVRSSFIIVQSEEDPNMRVLAQVKNNLGPKAPSLSFYIEGDSEGRWGFRWGTQVELDAEGLLRAQRTDTRKRERGQVDAAKAFLTEILSNGPMLSTGLFEKAEAAGISTSTIWRAKPLLDIKCTKERGTGKWWWRLG